MDDVLALVALGLLLLIGVISFCLSFYPSSQTMELTKALAVLIHSGASVTHGRFLIYQSVKQTVILDFTEDSLPYGEEVFDSLQPAIERFVQRSGIAVVPAMSSSLELPECRGGRP